MTQNRLSKRDPGTHSHHHGEHKHPCSGSGKVLTIRSHSGLSGDMFLAGMLRMTGLSATELDPVLASITPELSGTLTLVQKQVNQVGGWGVRVLLPHQHEHRTLSDITALIQKSGLAADAKELAVETFTLLARAEAKVHEKKPEEIHFHEVGALDSILDICLTCELFCRLSPDILVVSPLPVADGHVRCAHGVLPVPAPAVMELLQGIPIRPFPGQGETLTPTAVALLISLKAQFGTWPAMCMEAQALVYGNTVFPNAPNGAVFVMGRCT